MAGNGATDTGFPQPVRISISALDGTFLKKRNTREAIQILIGDRWQKTFPVDLLMQDTRDGDQRGGDEDVQITKDIRSGIMDADLSFNAKNIKIITKNERVTLKGVVESDAEHKAILKIAGNHANSGKIHDDLKVNSN